MHKTLMVRGNTLTVAGYTYRCAVGRGGIIPASQKREGDGCTPAGAWLLRECWYRADRLSAPRTDLPLRIIRPEDAWCDDPKHALYNQHFTLGIPQPPASFENLWREDEVYDLIVPLGYNDGPIVPGKGSAIFLHVATPGYAPTEGCVALAKEDLLSLLAEACTAQMVIHA